MKILVVDDDVITRTILCASLVPLEGELREALNGVEALRMAADWLPDIVILDMMAGIDGYEICHNIKTAPELKHTRVIMQTSRGDADGVAIGREARADAYLLKPFDPDSLLATIRELGPGWRGSFPASAARS